MSDSILRYMNLSDPYERRARFFPALLSVLPLAPISAALGGPLLEWLKLLLAGVGIWAVVAVTLSHVASACGNRQQARLWPDWPHDSPTNRWLHPKERSVSEQQRNLWYAAIERAVGLSLNQIKSGKKEAERRATINDAIKALRDRFWGAPEAERLRHHNIEYGFARNLTGLRIVWVSFSALSCAGCWVAYLTSSGPLLWCVVSTVVLVLCLLLAYVVLPGYVKKKAHYYAEAFYGTLMAVDSAVNAEADAKDPR